MIFYNKERSDMMHEQVTFDVAIRKSLAILGSGENKTMVKTWRNEERPVAELAAELLESVDNKHRDYIVREDGAVGHTGNDGLTISWLYWPV